MDFSALEDDLGGDVDFLEDDDDFDVDFLEDGVDALDVFRSDLIQEDVADQIPKINLPLEGDLPKLFNSSILSPNEVFANIESLDETFSMIGFVAQKFPILQSDDSHQVMNFVLSNNCKRIMCYIFSDVVNKHLQEIILHGVT